MYDTIHYSTNKCGPVTVVITQAPAKLRNTYNASVGLTPWLLTERQHAAEAALVLGTMLSVLTLTTGQEEQRYLDARGLSKYPNHEIKMGLGKQEY